MVHEFLLGLDDIYGTIRSTLLALDPLPSLNKVYSSLIQEERVRTMQRPAETGGDQMALYAANRTRVGQNAKWDNNSDKSAVCVHCNRTGHTAIGCFKIIAI